MDAVVEKTETGESRIHIGITVCDGPGQHRLLLTKPYHQAGHVVEIPRSRIEAVTPVDDDPDSENCR
jgi:hypothetical protein